MYDPSIFLDQTANEKSMGLKLMFLICFIYDLYERIFLGQMLIIMLAMFAVLKTDIAIIKMNNMCTNFALRYLLMQLFLMYDITQTFDFDVFLISINYIIGLSIANRENPLLLAGFEIFSTTCLTIFYQNNVSILTTLIYYVILFRLLIFESSNVTLFKFCMCVFCAAILHRNILISICCLLHTIFLLIQYDDMHKSKFAEFATWCKCMHLYPSLSYRSCTLKTNFSLLTHILLSHCKNNIFISDKNKPKKYFKFCYDKDKVEIRAHAILAIKRSNFLNKILRSIKYEKISFSSHPLLRIEEIFTLKMYYLIKILTENFDINLTKKICMTYIALIEYDMLRIYGF